MLNKAEKLYKIHLFEQLNEVNFQKKVLESFIN